MDTYTQPNWGRSILITIDTQNDFTLPGAIAEVDGTMDILAVMKGLLNAYRTLGLPVLHVVRLYREDASNVDLCRRDLIESGVRIAVPNSEGAELAEDIRPKGGGKIDAEKLLKGGFQEIGPKEWIMYKSRWGAFYKTDLEEFLRNQEIDTLVFTGCNFPNCPRTSMYEASERDLRVVMVSDAVSRTYEKGIQEMRDIGVYVCTSEDVLKMINQTGK